MNILVLANSAKEGGALTILNNLYQDVLKNDTNNTWIFVVSLDKFKDSKHIKIIKTKEHNSRINQWYFETFTRRKLIKKLNIDYVLSLQNTTVKHTDVKQILYLQQSLPFAKRRFSLFEDRKMWFYQNIVGYYIENSIKRSDYIIVQSEWMKRVLVSDMKKEPSVVSICRPRIQQEYIKKNQLSNPTQFFYPASSYRYKNHHMILQAFEDIENDYKIVFTLDKDFDNLSQDLYKFSIEHNINVDFIGSISYDKVFDYYSKSVLIFASDIETFGLPLLEARESKALVFALDTEFSREILKSYKNGYFFSNVKELRILIENVLKRVIMNIDGPDEIDHDSLSLYQEVEKIVQQNRV